MSTLFEAVQTSSLDVVMNYIDTNGMPSDNEFKDYEGLHLAIMKDYDDITYYLLEKNCRVNNINPVDPPQDSVLHLAIKLGKSDIAKKLIERGASLETPNRKGQTPFHLALSLKRHKILEIILEATGRMREQQNRRE